MYPPGNTTTLTCTEQGKMHTLPGAFPLLFSMVYWLLQTKKRVM
jgi:hypothetical protein